MKFFVTLLVGITVLASKVSTRETPPMTGSRAEEYRSGAVHMGLMSLKRATYSRNRNSGLYRNSQKWKPIKTLAKCKNGVATTPNGDIFRCKNIDLVYFANHADLGSATGEGSSIWGWTAPDGREFAAIGQADGAAFVEVDGKTGALVYLGRLPQPKDVEPEIWREIRMMKNYAVIGSEARGHGIQIFDMQKNLLHLSWKAKLPSFKPKVFDPETDITGHFKGLPTGATHNIVTNPDRVYAVAVGARPRNSTCAAGLIFIDLKSPSKPTSPGCNAADGYVHDAQCLPYRGPDRRYHGRDICYGYNENSLTIYDVTDRTNSSIISITSYEGAAYTHQGSVLNKNWQDFLIMDDEYDEYDGTGLAKDGFPVSYIWDIQDLQKPKQTGYFKSSVRGIDHNQYINGNFVYQSNYGAGLRILDISTVKRDPTGKGIREVGWGGIIDFVGSWSSYGLFKSGWILINTIERGVYSVRYTGERKYE
ncbi:hypothetical protein BGX38DRAFT_1251615 [Terfezia claveryi]|nr:hypothetical protein BGX38DRAFT_1251615 [Terfezia claveryi]